MNEENENHCQAWTKAALQRFTRGPEIMMTLSRFLDEKVEMEKKLRQIRHEFLTKWDKKVKNNIGNNLPQDDLKEVMEKILAAESQKAEFHSHAIGQLQNQNGPIPILHNYIYGSGFMMDIINLKTLYNDSVERQKKMEKEIKNSQKYYHFLQSRENKLRSELKELEKQEGQNHKIQKLTEELEEHESHVARAKQSYLITVRAEERSRPEFTDDMERFHDGSDRYETTRLDKVKTVLEKLMTDEHAAVNTKSSLEALYSDGLKKLKKFDVQKEVEENNKLFSFQYQFPSQDDKDSDIKAETQKGTRNESKRAKRRLEKKPAVTDEVQVFKPAPIDDKVLFQKSSKIREMIAEVTASPRALPLPSPRPTKVDVSDFDLPNLVTDHKVYKALEKKTTTIDMEYDSDSSSDEEEQEKISTRGSDANTSTMMKVKLYAVKTFTARTSDEISFKKGHKVCMIQPEDAEGLAYGYVKKGKLKKRKMFGFFPAKLVSKDGKKKSTFKAMNPLKKLLTQEKGEQDSNKTVLGKLKMIS